MNLITAKHLGMCGGVRRAIRQAQQVEEPTMTTIKGEIVHNALVNERMQALGFAIDSELERERLPDTPAVLITAHGTSDRMKARLREAGKQIVDATCPLVRRIHTLTTQLSHEGWFIILIGQIGHAEALGIVEDLDRYAIVDSERQVGTYAARRLAVVCQSTTPPELARRISTRINKRNPHAEIRYEETICGPTRRRQEAVADLLDQVDLLLVVGDPASRNSRGLAERAHEARVRYLLVSSPDDLDKQVFRGCRTIGLTAGASTPDDVIKAVENRARTLLESY